MPNGLVRLRAQPIGDKSVHNNVDARLKKFELCGFGSPELEVHDLKTEGHKVGPNAL